MSEPSDAPRRVQALDVKATRKLTQAESQARRNARCHGLEGDGALRRVIVGAVEASGLEMDALTVLARGNDPYRLDTPAGHRDGKWLADCMASGHIHLRGLHYRIVATGNIRMPNGQLYVNNEQCWNFLSDRAAKAARWLGYVPFEQIVDERNAEPIFCVKEPGAPKLTGSLNRGIGISVPPASIEVPDLRAAMPVLGCESPYSVRQPYRIIFIGEKVSLRDVLTPVYDRVGDELLLPTGEISDTQIAAMAARAARDGRPAVVLYFSDFDPSGRQMPVSVSRKLQALRDRDHHNLDIAVYPVALTKEQCIEHNLPSTPLKETEKRAGHWREAMGREQTEIDALLALHPGVLERIARDAVKPFYDSTLWGRSGDARRAWLREAEGRLTEHPLYEVRTRKIYDALERSRSICDEQQAIIDAALAKCGETAFALLEAQEKANEELADIELPEADWPEPELEAPPEPIFTTDDSFADASRKLIALKGLDLGDPLHPHSGRPVRVKRID